MYGSKLSKRMLDMAISNPGSENAATIVPFGRIVTRVTARGGEHLLRAHLGRMRRLIAHSVNFDDIRAEFGLPEEYPAEAVAEAADATDRAGESRRDARDLVLVTIDPPGSMDLDQAMLVARDGPGFVLYYAIADVGALVVPGGCLDTESHRRGQTVYLPDGTVPLHPKNLSEGSACLLPDEERPAALWTIRLGADGEPTSWEVERATVMSRARFTYAEVQAAVDAGSVHPSLEPLADLGALRIDRAAERGAIELKLPEQDVVRVDDRWTVTVAPRTDVDDWNAQMSLLTGMCAARIMLDGGVGLLRTLPPAADEDVEALRRAALALDIAWPQGEAAGTVLARLDANAPTTMALMTEATRLLRGANYTPFDGDAPQHPNHSGIGAPYAHVTAPLRRLIDRFGTEICLALVAGTPVPDWVTAAVATLPDEMRSTGSVANKVDRACVDLTEATVLAERVGEQFTATVLRGRDGKKSAQIFLDDPVVIADCDGDPKDGTRAAVRLAEADTVTRRVRFELA